jgi:hypothetical protein
MQQATRIKFLLDQVQLMLDRIEINNKKLNQVLENTEPGRYDAEAKLELLRSIMGVECLREGLGIHDEEEEEDD